MPMQQMYQPQYTMNIAPQTCVAPAVEETVQAQVSTAKAELDMDAAFEAAFNDVLAESQHDELDALESSLHQPEEVVEQVQQQPVVGEEEKTEEEKEKDENDELAKTAAELLDSVSTDTSSKFQNSKFLLLMRRLRDREVRVEGDKVVEVC